jgi:anti-sigma regulatory factor (Ser/Thr protein kinase)
VNTETPGSNGGFAFSPHEPPPLSRLRQWVRTRLRDASADLVCDVELVITELVSNAYDHGRGLLAVSVVPLADGAVRVEVDDAASDAVLRLGKSALGTTRGRGLVVIDSVCSAWGVRRRPDRKTVWATVPNPA